MRGSSALLIGSALAAAACSLVFDKRSSAVDSSSPPDCPEFGQPFKVQITVLTTHPDAPTATSVHTLIDDDGNPITSEGDTGLATTVSGEALLRREIEVHLSNNFVDVDGNPVCDTTGCVSFEVGDIRFRADIESTSCTDLLAFGTADDLMNLDSVRDDYVELGDALEAAVDTCEDPEVRAPEAINLYIFDNCKLDGAGVVQCDDMIDSRGRNNAVDGVYFPYVFLDLARLQHQTQSPEEHEFGHAFGLAHNCDPDVLSAYHDSNIMQSTCHGAPSGGARNLGFGVVSDYSLENEPCDTGSECTGERDQVMLIMTNAKTFSDSWCTDEASADEDSGLIDETLD